MKQPPQQQLPFVLSLALFLWLAFSPLSSGAQSDAPFPLALSTADTTTILSEIRKAQVLVDMHPDKALLLLRRQAQRSRETGFSYGLCLSYSGMAGASYYLGQYPEALSYCRRALLNSVQSVHGRRMVPSLLNYMGVINHAMGNYEQALTCYSKALKLAGALNISKGIDHIYSNLSTVMLELGQSGPRILYYLDKAENAAREHRNYSLLCVVLINKALYWSNSNAKDTTRHYLQTALRMARQHGLSKLEYMATTNLGVIYVDRKKPDSALAFFRQANAIDAWPDRDFRDVLLRATGDAYLQKKDYARAEHYMLAAKDMAERMHMGRPLQDAYHSLSNLYHDIGRHEDAYRYLKQFITLKDSLENKEVTDNISRMEVRYRTIQKDKELVEKQLLIARQQTALKQKNTWIIGIAGGALLIITLSITLYRSNRHRQRLQVQKIRSLEQEQQIVQLKAMMEGEEKERSRIARELHDGIGGMLSAVNLNASILRKEHDSLSQNPTFGHMTQMLTDMGTEIRRTAHNLMPDALLRHSLPEAVQHFCEPIQQSGALKIDLQHYGPFDRLEYSFRLSVYRILQELVQNIVKHAGARQALLQMVLHEESLILTVEDDGTGFNLQEHSSGLGLHSLYDRVHSLNGQLSIETAPGKGTTVYIELETASSLNAPS